MGPTCLTQKAAGISLCGVKGGTAGIRSRSCQVLWLIVADGLKKWHPLRFVHFFFFEKADCKAVTDSVHLTDWSLPST